MFPLSGKYVIPVISSWTFLGGMLFARFVCTGKWAWIGALVTAMVWTKVYFLSAREASLRKPKS